MQKSYNKPVFIVGASRSGTTLLYSILLSSGLFPIYLAETKLLNDCATKYGSFKKINNYQRFINDFIKSKQFSRSGLDCAEFKQNAISHNSSYLEFLKYFMNSISEKQGKNRWVEKTPNHISNIAQIKREIPDALFIHMIRDGRAVALSRRKLGWTGTKSSNPIKQLLFNAFEWEKIVRHGRSVGKIIGDSYLEVRYEDLILNLDSVLIKINNFLGINISMNNLAENCFGALEKANSAFENHSGGISKKYIHIWKNKLTKKEVSRLNIAIGSTLRDFGYEAENDDDSKRDSLYIKVGIQKNIFVICYFFKNILKKKLGLGRLGSSVLEFD